MRLSISEARINADQIADNLETLEPYRKYLEEVTAMGGYGAPEASINLPSDLAQREVVEAVHQEVEVDGLRYIFVIGIGGSSLGTEAVYDAMFGYKDVWEHGKRPKMIFLDTNDTSILASVRKTLLQTLELEELLVVSITKSGTTTETLVNTEIVLAPLLERFGESVYERVVGITTEGSDFANVLKKKGAHVLHIPVAVGGRYSVLSPVGIFPLLTVHVDVDALIAGAMDMRARALSERVSENYSMQSAIVLYLAAKRGERINTNFIFHPELESLGKWYRQLLAESIGKRENEKGDIVNAGITPEIAIGSTDLHSMGQLYIGGPRDKIATFITAEELACSVAVGNETALGDVSKLFAGKTAHSVQQAIYEGTKIAYEKNNLSFMEVVLEDISPYELGQFMQFKMMEVMYLAKLFGVNAFNQPNVESYKKETREILEGKE